MENRTSYYDSLFLAAAQEEEIPLLTLDRKLYEKVKAKRDVRFGLMVIKELKNLCFSASISMVEKPWPH